MSLFIGLMSGTSGDGIDASLCEINEQSISPIGHWHLAYPADLQQELKHAAIQPELAVSQIMKLDQAIAQHSVTSIQQLLQRYNVQADQVTAIGSHGHTLRHQPQPSGYSWQIGDAAVIANATGIDCVSDFRRADIAVGGEGAPLVPAFHRFLLETGGAVKAEAALVNIGGIANVSIIKQDHVLGFDTGPGNALIDEWLYQCRGQAYDKDGQLAAAGQVQQDLLQQWVAHPYLQQTPPKSTGRELFRLDQFGSLTGYRDEDIAATLTRYTALTIDQSLEKFAKGLAVYICGGGVRNSVLLQQLLNLGQQRGVTVASIADLNQREPLDPDYIESMAFAWLAWCRVHHRPGNLVAATGARRPAVLGAIYAGKSG